MAGFIGFIIVMAVLGNIIEGLDSAHTAMAISALLAALSGYKLTKKNLARILAAKKQNRLEEQKEELRREIEQEKERIASIQEIQPETIDEPYYPEVKYFNR